jgi:uncharacterized protein YhaN
MKDLTPERQHGFFLGLADLSKGTQVLFFTHHMRMMELAREIKSENGLFLKRLN